MKMKEKGFTIVELLTVFAILSIILGMVVVNVNNYSSKQREKDYENLVKIIEENAKVLVNKNEDLFVGVTNNASSKVIDVNGNTLNGCKFSYDLLVDNKLMDEDTVNPVDNKAFYNNNYSIIATLSDKGTYNYELKQNANNSYASCSTNIICKRATTLHTETCTQTDWKYYCSGAGYTASGSKGTTTITYGSLGTKGKLVSGDAFDCDVNGDGIYDENTERFYYVTDMDDSTAVLIYYNNVSNGKPSNSTTYAYDASKENWHGPRTAIEQLPSTSEWRNVSLTSNVRNIVTENGTKTTTGGTLPDSFSYVGKAARLLTIQEVRKATGISNIPTWQVGELDNFNYLLENTKYSNGNNAAWAWWLENPRSGNSDIAWYVNGNLRNVSGNTVSNAGDYGVRPAIEVLKSNISY